MARVAAVPFNYVDGRKLGTLAAALPLTLAAPTRAGAALCLEYYPARVLLLRLGRDLPLELLRRSLFPVQHNSHPFLSRLRPLS
jgi:hypothetical protein